jgi:diguanylate cyclase (GGDEF)-like protein/PAS domain S-box-containing protein
VVIHQSVRAETEGLEAFRAMFEHNPEGVLFTRPDQGLIVAANPAACAILAMSEEEICRVGRDGLRDPDDMRWPVGLQELARTGQAIGPARMRRGDGKVIETEMTVHAYRAPDGTRRGCAIFREVTPDSQFERLVEDLTARLEALTIGDELTGLRNRRGLVVSGTQLLEMADRRTSEVQVLFVDVHGLADLNDLLGYEAGDAALQAVARALAVTFRRSDVIARIGGTQFVVLAMDLHESDRTAVTARIRRHLSDPATVEIVGGGIDVALGWATRMPTDPASLEDLIARSDRAMIRTTGWR